jgi:hypothetical protein
MIGWQKVREGKEIWWVGLLRMAGNFCSQPCARERLGNHPGTPYLHLEPTLLILKQLTSPYRSRPCQRILLPAMEVVS